MIKYVIKKGNKYVSDNTTENSFTKLINKAFLFNSKKAATFNAFTSKGEFVVQVSVKLIIKEIK
jgi:hypothetical protein